MITPLTDRREIDGLREEWTQLLFASARPTVFLTWEWMTTWLDQFGSGGTPYVLVVRDHLGRMIGLAPLFRARDASPFGLQTWRLMGTGVGADHLMFLSREGLEHQVHGELAAHLLSVSAWDVLEWLRVDDTFAGIIEDALGGAPDVTCTVVAVDRCPFIALPAAWDDYLAMIGPHRRSELGRQGRRLEKQGAVRITRVQTPAELRNAWHALLRLHQGRRDAVAGGQSAFLTGPTRAFHEAFALQALERGWLRLYVMHLDDRPVAVEYAYSIGGRVTDYQGGFDMAWAKYGVGTLLTAHVMREAIGEGAVEFDLLRGDEQYKEQRWAAQSRTDVHLTAWRRRFRVEALLALRRWARDVRGRVRG